MVMVNDTRELVCDFRTYPWARTGRRTWSEAGRTPTSIAYGFRQRGSPRIHVCEHLDRCLRRWIVRVEVQPGGHHRTRMAENRGHCRDRNASRHQGGTKVMPEPVQCA